MTLGDGLFESGTFGTPVVAPIGGLKLVELDGTVRNVANVPHTFLPDGTGFRVFARFIDEGESLVTYDGVVAVYVIYDVITATYDTYEDLRADAAHAMNADFDLSCCVSGVGLRSGRSGLFDVIDAATVRVSLRDPHGIFDPRLTDTSFGPGRRVRSGTYVRVEVYRAGEWIPLFTGLTDNWRRILDPEEESRVELTATDFLQGLAIARTAKPLDEQTTSGRIQFAIDQAWDSRWGGQLIDEGAVVLYADDPEDRVVLNMIRAAAAVEDGRAFIRGRRRVRLPERNMA